MTRQTASTNGFSGKDDFPYQATLVKPENGWLQESDGQYGKRMQLVVDFEVDGETVRDWFGLTLKPTPGGEESKLRRLLNALAEKTDDEEPWWETSSLEWGYDHSSGNTPAYAHIEAGLTWT